MITNVYSYWYNIFTPLPRRRPGRGSASRHGRYVPPQPVRRGRSSSGLTSEKTKMLNGDPHDATDPDLAVEREHARELTARYNRHGRRRGASGVAHSSVRSAQPSARSPAAGGHFSHSDSCESVPPWGSLSVTRAAEPASFETVSETIRRNQYQSSATANREASLRAVGAVTNETPAVSASERTISPSATSHPPVPATATVRGSVGTSGSADENTTSR